MHATVNGLRVLVVVPASESDAAFVASVVEELGFRAQIHRDAGSALEAVEYDRPALVVHGWDLPDMDAVTFHGAIQKRAGGRPVPTLAIAPDDGTARRLPATSASIVRPLRREALAARVSELAARAGLAAPMSPTGDQVAPARQAHGEPTMRLSVIGLGEWGTRGAELFDRKGVPARAIDASTAVDRSSLPEERRHLVHAPGDYAAASRALAADAGLEAALRADADAGLFIVVANLGLGVGALAASLLARIADIAPRAGRHAIVRLPGPRSGPDERALTLVAVNAILQEPAAGILLVQPPDGHPTAATDADPAAPLLRLLDLWVLASGAGGEAIQPLSLAALERLLATPGFLGWRETALTADDMAPEGHGWCEMLAPAAWQPQGFAWGEAQAALPLARLPWSWLEGGGQRQFERFVQDTWDEAAPCTMTPALYVGDPTAAVLLAAGMPYPQGLLALRDSVEADRARLAEKRRKAEAPIPLGDEFLPPGLEVVVAPVERPEPEAPPPEPEGPHPEPMIILEPAAPSVTEPTIETGAEDVWPAGVAETPAEPVAEAPPDLAIPELEPGPMPVAYEAALALVRRAFSAQDLRSEVDLGEVRYALYDLLEVLREEPHALLPEVFRPELDEYFERHHVNVAVLAILTGDTLKKSLSEVIDLGTAALLHDIGMLPTRETWDVGVKLPPKVFDRTIRPHPDMGFRRLQEITGMTPTMTRMVLEEHERMDSTGYPEGLRGSSIDSGARILAVCDTLEALTHPRPYRDRVSPGEALARLQTLGEYTLDSSVVEALTGELKELLRRGVRQSDRR